MRKTTYRLAVDIGASSMKVALWDGRRLWRVNRTDFGSATVKPDWIAQRLRSKLRSWGEPTIRSAVVGVPALVDPEHRMVLTSVNLGWRNYPLASVLSKALGVPVRVETDIFLAARAEAEVGAGRNSADFVYVNLGTGVSNVRMLGKEPQLGAHGLAANLGMRRCSVAATAARPSSAGAVVPTALNPSLADVWWQRCCAAGAGANAGVSGAITARTWESPSPAWPACWTRSDLS